MRHETYRGMTMKNRSGRRDGWHVNLHGHVRWGTRDEIRADIDHAITYGHLPAPKHLWA